jgi:hypothetical protein
MTTFPQNNLPKDAQPWAREVTKYLSSLIQSSKADQINNSARDNQLNSSLIALTGVVSGLKTVQGQITSALTDIGILESTVLVAGEPDKINGANIKVGTLSATQITTGTLTGITLQTASSGRRVQISGTSSSFFDDAGAFTGEITSSGSSGSSSLFLTNVKNGGFGVGSSSRLQLSQGSATLALTSSGGVGSGSLALSATGVNVTNTLTAQGLQINNSGILVANITGQLKVDGNVFFTGLSPTTNAANMRVATVGAKQVFEVTSSSKKFKNTITPIFDVEDVFHKKLLEIPVVAFKYNEDYLNQEDPRFNKMIPGFIAEDLYKKYPIGAELENGKPIDWNPRYIIPGMLALIQELYVKIETLEKGA